MEQELTETVHVTIWKQGEGINVGAGCGTVDQAGNIECTAQLGADEWDSDVTYTAIEEQIRQGATSGEAGGYRWEIAEESDQEQEPTESAACSADEQMTSNNVVTTIRDTVRTALDAHIGQAAIHRHERNYWRLDCYRDGALDWQEDVSNDAYTADVLALYRAGTGSVPCNCDDCAGPDAFDCPTEIEHDADTLTVIQSDLLTALDAIPFGYFADEATQ